MKLEPYVDGYLANGREITKVPRCKFPFQQNPVADTFTRQYERDYWYTPALYVPMGGDRYDWENFVIYSEQINNAAWTKTNVTVAVNNRTAPDGNPTMDRIGETSANAEHAISQSVTLTGTDFELVSGDHFLLMNGGRFLLHGEDGSAGIYETSIFAKYGLARPWIRVQFTDVDATVFFAWFNIQSGYIGAISAGVTAKLLPLGGGYYQCVIAFDPAVGTGTMKINLSANGSTTSYTGLTSSHVYLWGGQINIGEDAPYIPTTTEARAISAPLREKSDPMAYLLWEQDPLPENSKAQVLQKVFGRIPLTQTAPSSRIVVKLGLTGEFPQVNGNTLITQPDPNVALWIFYTQVAVTSDSGPPSGANFPSGGTYTISFGSDTTSALAWNASAGTVETALNALTSISDRGAVTVTGTYNTSFSISFDPYPAGTIDVSSLTGAGVVAPFGVTTYNNGTGQVFSVGPCAPISGGTFTVELFSDTSSGIAYNATKATVLTAIEALSSVGSTGVSIFTPSTPGWGPLPPKADGTQLKFTVTILFPESDADGSSLTPAGCTAQITSPNSSFGLATLTFTGILPTTRFVYAASHGILASDDIIVTADTVQVPVESGDFSVVDVNTLSFTSASGSAVYNATNITAVGKKNGNQYAADAVNVPTQLITTFALPGVTAGIETATDIPLPVRTSSGPEVLAAIFGGVTQINYDVGQLGQWQKSPILSQTTEQLNPQQL